MKVGDIIQVTLPGDWEGCLMFIDEVNDWGVQCGMRLPCQGTAYMRLKWNEFEGTNGHAVMMPGNILEDFDGNTGMD